MSDVAENNEALSPEEIKKKEKDKAFRKAKTVYFDLPDPVCMKFSINGVILGMQNAGWDKESDVNFIGEFIQLIERTEDAKTAELITSGGNITKKDVIDSFVSNLGDVKAENYERVYPELMSEIYVEWNKANPDKPQKHFDDMEFYYTVHREKSELPAKPENLSVTREGFFAGAKNCGLRNPEDATLISALFKVGNAMGAEEVCKKITYSKFYGAELVLKAFVSELNEYVKKNGDNSLAPYSKEIGTINNAWKRLNPLQQEEQKEIDGLEDSISFVDSARTQGWKEEDVELLNNINSLVNGVQDREFGKEAAAIRSKIMGTPLDPNKYYTSRNALINELLNIKGMKSDLPGYSFASEAVEKSIPLSKAETHAEEKAAWLDKMRKAGWDKSHGEEFLNTIYEARLNADGSVNMKYDKYISKADNAENAYMRYAYHIFGLRKELAAVKEKTEAQKEALNSLREEFAVWKYTSNDIFSRDSLSEERKPKEKVKDIDVAEFLAFADSCNNKLSDRAQDKLERELQEKGVSRRVLADTIRSRVVFLADKALKSKNIDDEQKSYINSVKNRFERSVGDLKVGGDELSRQRDHADSIIDGWTMQGFKSYTGVKKPKVSRPPREEAVKNAEAKDKKPEKIEAVPEKTEKKAAELKNGTGASNDGNDFGINDPSIARDLLNERQQKKEQLTVILRTLERTGNGYINHENTAQFNQMMADLDAFVKFAKPEEEDLFNEMLGYCEDSMKKYMEKGYESSWHSAGNIRKECALLGISIIDPYAGQHYIDETNAHRWEKNHVDLQTIKNKVGVGLDADAKKAGKTAIKAEKLEEELRKKKPEKAADKKKRVRTVPKISLDIGDKKDAPFLGSGENLIK